MTWITFERSGGFLGQNVHLDLDLDTIPADEALRLMHQIQTSDFFKLPENLDAQAGPDEFLYSITVEAGSVRHGIRTTDSTMPDVLRPMIDTLSTIAIFS